MLEAWLAYAGLFVTGLAAGALNVVAGGGSFLTLPILILMGLPAAAANGTNRVGIVLQNVGAVWGFRRHGLWDPAWALWAAGPATAGSILGTLAALWVDDKSFKQILATLMVAITLWTLWDPMKPPVGAATRSARPSPLVMGAGFFVAGVYGGFVQAGVGFLLLAVTTYAGYDLVRGNALKVLCILIFTPITLAMFAWQGHVDWGLGLVLAAGNVVGGLFGVRLTVLKGHRWVRGVVTLSIIVLAVKLWISS